MTQKNLDETPRNATTDVRPRALSLLQPWAWAVLHGPKDVENRTWWADLRGHVWIHASRQVTPRYYREACERIALITKGALVVPPLADLPRGAMVGRVLVTDVILPGGYASADDRVRRTAARRYELDGRKWGDVFDGGVVTRHPLRANRWHFPNQYGYTLADRRPLVTPLVCRGHQKAWRLQPELAEFLKTMLHDARVAFF